MILAPNHFSYMDHFLMGCYIRRKVRFMAKSQLFKAPMQFIYTHGGVFPVRRGARDEETFITAEAILGKGGALAMYCEGGRSRTGEVADQAKRGIGRLALETGAPGRPDRDPRLLAHPQLEAAAVPQGHRPVRRRHALGARSRTRPASSSRRSPTPILIEIRRLYSGLEENGRRETARRVRAVGRGERAVASAATTAAGRCLRGLNVSGPLGVGEVIRRVFSIYVDQAAVLMPAAAVVFVLSGILGTVLGGAPRARDPRAGHQPRRHDPLHRHGRRARRRHAGRTPRRDRRRTLAGGDCPCSAN